MNDDFTGEDDLQTFDGFLKYQAVDPIMVTPDQLAMWRGDFEKRRGGVRTPRGLD